MRPLATRSSPDWIHKTTSNWSDEIISDWSSESDAQQLDADPLDLLSASESDSVNFDGSDGEQETGHSSSIKLSAMLASHSDPDSGNVIPRRGCSEERLAAVLSVVPDHDAWHTQVVCALMSDDDLFGNVPQDKIAQVVKSPQQSQTQLLETQRR